MQKWTSEVAATAVEYAVMISLIAVAVIAGALLLGNATNDQLDCTGSSLAASSNQC